MIRASLILLCGLASVSMALAQSATDPNEGSRITFNSVNSSYSFSWWGRSGSTYFVLQSDDLFDWNYVPIIETGANQVISWGFTSSADKFFVRLKHTNIPTDDPQGDDFDRDGVSNLAELQAGLDPLSTTDTEGGTGDGLPDDWEMFHFGNLTHSPGDIEDGGTLTNKEQAELGLNPLLNEAASSTVRKNYSYDPVGRLTGASGAVTIGYTLDEEGNITSVQ